jgi:DNA-binding NarL/FixJ family response regulator
MTPSTPMTKILVVDDHPAVRHGLVQLLGSEPDLEICGEADDRRSMLAAIERAAPDLVVLDVGLKDKSSSGLDLIADIHARLGEASILVYSMHDEVLYAERALRSGARGYLMKQEPVREVLVAIRHILAGEIYVSRDIKRSLLLQHVGGKPESSAHDPVEILTAREFEVFRLIGQGWPPREIAKTLNLSVKTVETHRLNMRRKLDLDNAAALTRLAVRWMRQSE